jgi:ABC-type lipoprotein export system ATPase subunit
MPMALVDATVGDHPSDAGVVEAVFHAHNVSKIYKMNEVEVQAPRCVTIDLYEGEFLVLLDPSGSGKSTLLNILGALDIPTSGEVYYRDHVLTQANDAELTRFRREHAGFVFQFYNLIPSLTALENVAVVTGALRAQDRTVESSGSTKTSALGVFRRQRVCWASCAVRARSNGEPAI